MTREFDRLITDAAPGLPDCGPDRRTVRVLLREKVRRGTHRRLAHSTRAVMAACLLLVVLLSTPAGNLISDSFELTDLGPVQRVEGLPGIEYQMMQIGRSGEKTYMPPGSTVDDAREMLIQRVAGEGELIGVWALEISGVADWKVRIRRVVNGEEFAISRPPEGYPSIRKTDHARFVKTHLADLLGRVGNDEPTGTFVREFDGVWFEIDYWTYEYAGFGPVTYYDGSVLN